MLVLISSAPVRRLSRVTIIATVVGVTLLFSVRSAFAVPPSAGWAISSLAQPTNFQTSDFTESVQNVYVNATGGTFALSYEGQETTAISYDATAGELQAALEALTKIGAGNVVVTGGKSADGTTSRYFVTFVGRLGAEAEVAQLQPHPHELTGGDSTAGVNEVTHGKEARDSYAVTITNVGSRATSGTIKIVDTLPLGVTARGIIVGDLAVGEPQQESVSNQKAKGFTCVTSPTIQCEYSKTMEPGDEVLMKVLVSVAAGSSGSVTNAATVEGGGVSTPVSTAPPTTAANTLNGTRPAFSIEDFGVSAYGLDGLLDTNAGDHPYAVMSRFDLTSVVNQLNASGFPYEAAQEAKDVVIDLPLGFVGDPQAVPRCAEGDLVAGTNGASACPLDSRVGSIDLKLHGGISSSLLPSGLGEGVSAIYNLEPEKGYPAEFGFTFSGVGIVMYATVVRTGAGYQLQVRVPGVVRELEPEGATLVFFGNPGERDGGSTSATAFFTNPGDCAGGSLVATIEANSWREPHNWQARRAIVYPQITNCDMLQFSPEIEMKPVTTLTDSPSGDEIDLRIPQMINEFPRLATPDLKNATMSLPVGVAVSASAAGGLVGCRQTAPEGIEMPRGDVHPDEAGEGEEIGADGLSRLVPGHCPAKSRIGEAEVTTPVLPQPLRGHVYLAQPKCGGNQQAACSEASSTNGELYGLYVEVSGSGVIIKLHGKVSVNPKTGQLTTTFAENPQLPFEELKLKLNGGQRAPLANPQTCGTATTTSELEPWSAPESGPNATPSSFFEVTGCANPMPFAPAFSAGTVTPLAGGFTPFTMTLTRKDGEQDLAGVSLTMPPGLAGLVSKVPLCPEPQASLGTCPAASRIGTVNAAAGAGSEPLWLSGPVYLTGPYKGAPFGLSVVVPAVAGPFNLGNVIERAAINLDPHTAQVTVTSDPFPQIRDGVPFRLKTVNVTVDRPEFMFNPTNCSQLHLTGTVSGDMPDGSAGATAPVSTPFAVAGCRNLPFKPSFSALTHANPSRNDGAYLHVVVKSGAGQANVGSVKVQLPKSLPARLSTLNLACLEKVFNENPAACPAGSKVGSATAYTPVLPVALTGPAYFVSHGGAKFPELVLVLQGDGVTLDLAGETFISSKGITSSTFRSVPDVPITRFDLVLPAGAHSALAGNGSFCTGTMYMPTQIKGQNGAVLKQNTKVAVTGCKPAVTVVRSSVKGAKATIVASVPSAGRLVASGKGLSRVTRRLGKAGTTTVTLTLSKQDQLVLAQHPGRRLKVSVKLLFTPTHGSRLSASVTLLMG